jgi:hypothetical protein
MSKRKKKEEEVPIHEPIEGTFTELARASSIPPNWIIKDLLPVGLTGIIAPPKSMKTTMLMAMSLLVSGHQCSALPPEFKPLRTGRVVGWSYEATAGELLHTAEEGLGTVVNDDASIIIADDPFEFQLDDPQGIHAVIHWLDEVHPLLAWIDPLVEAHSQDEKDSGAMVQLLRPLHKWAKENDAAIVMPHHTRKKQGMDDSHNTMTDARGSSGIVGKMDGILVLTPVNDAGLIKVNATFKRGKSWTRDIQFKAYDAAANAPVTLPLGDVERMVCHAIKLGARERDLPKTLLLSKGRALQAVKSLEQHQHLMRDGMKILLTKKGTAWLRAGKG